MKTTELRKKSKNELENNLKELQNDLGRAFFKVAANKLKNVKEIKNKKKEIARILTIIKENQKPKVKN